MHFRLRHTVHMAVQILSYFRARKRVFIALLALSLVFHQQKGLTKIVRLNKQIASIKLNWQVRPATPRGLNRLFPVNISTAI